MSSFIVSSLLLSTVSAFCPPSSFGRSAVKSFALNAKDEQTIQDLNLEEMFEVFEAADTAPGSGPKMGGSKFDAKMMSGVSDPLGFFDPLGLCPDNETAFKKYRESELKHGRIAMLAVLGVVVGESGFNFFGQDIDGPAIYQYQQAEEYFNAWSYNVVGLTAAVEGYNIVQGWQSSTESQATGSIVANLKENYVNGDLKFDPLGFKPTDPAAFKLIQTKEINNGRLAMLAIAGIVAQELVTGEKIF